MTRFLVRPIMIAVCAVTLLATGVCQQPTAKPASKAHSGPTPPRKESMKRDLKLLGDGGNGVIVCGCTHCQFHFASADTKILKLVFQVHLDLKHPQLSLQRVVELRRHSLEVTS
jgi:hypothetical protein